MKFSIPKAAAIGLTTVSVFSMAGIGTASAATIDGSATPVANNNSGSTPVLSGLSDTPYGIQLQKSVTGADGNPGTAPDCSGTTAGGATHVYTYLIHANENPANLNFTSGEPGTLPDSSEVLAFFTTAGQLETESGSTDTAASPSGQVSLPPTMAYSFGQIVAGTGGGVPVTDLTANGGAWKAGWACYKSNSTTHAVTDFWGMTVTFTSTSGGTGDAEDFSWTAVPDGQSNSALPEVPLPILLPVGGAVLIGAGTLFSRRRRHSATQA